ncbi:hypothetical protein FGB62_85g04 [Gracilaria domingensis]|nr:hypothetical protein FGB62_85g04 [Gracilaria domingensis]
MHQWLLGWLKHLCALCNGTHPTYSSQSPSVSISGAVLDQINISLENGTFGIPSEWGRAPQSFQHLGPYKAENFKGLALFFGPVVFSGGGVPSKMTKLWAMTSYVTHVIFTTSFANSDAARLENMIQQLHELFDDCFNGSLGHLSCFTPTTHAILHFPRLMRECGPLRNVSQFITERVAGEVSDMVQSRVRPESNLYHKSMKLFSLRLLNSGMGIPKYKDTKPDMVIDKSGREGNENDEVDDGGEVVVGGQGRRSQALAFAHGILPITAYDIELKSLKTFRNAEIRLENESFKIETLAEVRKREQHGAYRARQRCWVAAHFSEGEDVAAAENQSTCSVYYGEQVKHWKKISVVRVDWQYGLAVNNLTGVPSVRLDNGARRGSLRDKTRSVEDVASVNRLIGFLDHDGRRHFMDPFQPELRTQIGMKLKGRL